MSHLGTAMIWFLDAFSGLGEIHISGRNTEGAAGRAEFSKPQSAGRADGWDGWDAGSPSRVFVSPFRIL